MRIGHRISLSLLLLFGTLLFTACPQHETISKILADPGRYHNKEVAVTGRVTNSYGVLNQGAYEIDDGTGRIWVVTKRGVPSRGAQVGAKGRVYTGFNLSGRDLGTVLEETDRRAKD
jgi:hypothetical protein